MEPNHEMRRLAALCDFAAACDLLLQGGCGTFLVGGRSLFVNLGGGNPDDYENDGAVTEIFGDAMRDALTAIRDNTLDCIREDFPEHKAP